MDEFDRHREPEQVYLPLPEKLYPVFYDLEMAGYQDDIPFYLDYCQTAESILEFGCGTGRITEKLQRAGRLLLGVDLNPAMLQRAVKKGWPGLCHFLCMDMRQPAFRQQFDRIIIGYNTLGLLGSLSDIKDCLARLRDLLRTDGLLLCQLYSPKRLLPTDRNIFQFSVHDDSRGNRLVKEIVRKALPEKGILVEERYRWRPLPGNTLSKGDWYTRYTMAGLTHHEWLRLFAAAGFTALESAEHQQQEARAQAATGSFLLAARMTLG